MNNKQSTSPLVSIVTPLYNAEPYLSKTIKSVLNQTYTNFEWIVVDDKSTDDSLAMINVIKDPRIIVIERKRNKGTAHARNCGLDRASGDYLLFLDADDELDPTFLEKQIEFIKEHGPIVTGSYRRVTEHSNTVFTVPKESTYKSILGSNPLSCLTTMYDFNLFRHERFDEDEIRHEDFLFWCRILKKGYIAYGNQECLATYNLHRRSKNSSKMKLAMPLFHMYRRKLGLSRLQAGIHLLHMIFYSKKKYRKVKY